jgi:hypothetical protein
MLTLLQPNEREELRRQLGRDIEIDAAAITAWRRSISMSASS